MYYKSNIHLYCSVQLYNTNTLYVLYQLKSLESRSLFRDPQKISILYHDHNNLSQAFLRKGRGIFCFAASSRVSKGWKRLTHFFSIGESMKRPAITDSVSDIFELDDSQPNPNRGNGVGGRGTASSHVHQAQHHGLSRQEQYLQHNCNPRHNNNINAMSIETDV